MSTHYFSCSGATDTDSTKSVTGHVTPNMCFCIRYGFQKKHDGTRYTELAFFIRCDLRVTYCIALHPGRETLTQYFSCSGGTGTDSRKSALGLLTPDLYFCIRWYLRVTHCIVERLGRKTLTHYFSCSGGMSTDSTKSATGHVKMNLCFCIRWDLRVT
jgi:hypothetical protein